MNIKNLIPILIVGFLVVIYPFTYTVDERERAILFTFKKITNDGDKHAGIKPGLHFKIPFMNTIKKLPAQIQTLDAKPERFLTGEKKYVKVDFFVKWRISNFGTFYRSTGRGNMAKALDRLEQIMKDGLRNEFAKRTIREALSEKRGAIMSGLQEKSNIIAKQLGIHVVDVRVSAIDFPPSVSESVFERMRSERERIAKDFRSRGQEIAEKIRAGADREVTVIKANAYREAEKIRGEGDAKSAEIYAKAYQQDKDFYAFYRSMKAYRTAFGNQKDIMVLEPNSEFFRYFKRQTGKTIPTNGYPN